MPDTYQQSISIRKSVILTTMIACVFSASDSADGINWIVSLDGWKAWSFLLLAHSYYSIMWLLERQAFREHVISPNGEHLQRGMDHQKYLTSCTKRHRFHVILMTRLVDALVLFGLLIIGWNILRPFLEATNFESTPIY